MTKRKGQETTEEEATPVIIDESIPENEVVPDDEPEKFPWAEHIQKEMKLITPEDVATHLEQLFYNAGITTPADMLLKSEKVDAILMSVFAVRKSFLLRLARTHLNTRQ